MKIIKSINNNFAVAEDSAGNQCIVSGKGIGFGTVPREVTDLGVINRTYYDVDSAYIAMINDFPEEIIDVSSKIIDYTRLVIDNSISSNIVFTLADHINFCIQRYQKHMNSYMSISLKKKPLTLHYTLLTPKKTSKVRKKSMMTRLSKK